MSCKTLLSRVPIVWLPGFHGLNRRPKIDPNLYLFHTKAMDYSIALTRQRINRETEWSDRSLASKHGEHHRHDNVRFVREHFFDPVNAVSSGRMSAFALSDELSQFDARIVERDGIFYPPVDITAYVELPERFRTVF